ncbi:hypothetical protein ABT040_18930 [Streptomyces sp. NPDC002688]|uniref:hypothetical protein n=1 Tax=Streptomyces sp. NPDC002688 TaxID=3154423 RepID=UPI003330D328
MVAEELAFTELVANLVALRADRLAGEPSDRTLAKVAGVSPTTIGAWLRGTQFPQQIDPVLQLLRAVRATAADLMHEPKTVSLLDERTWRSAYRAESRRRAGATGRAVEAARAETVLDRMRPGRPLSEVTDPFGLEVHQAISSPDAAAHVLPTYVPRAHDQKLAEVVVRAAAGESQLAVLVGRSSTGKTRTCWEALHLLRQQTEAWLLWHPLDPARPDAALAELPHLAPHTVVWLNEAQEYLLDDRIGEEIAAGLRTLLHDPHRRPVLVLATLWPDHWSSLTTLTTPDRHAQARELLAGRRINVPDSFTSYDLAGLSEAARRDPRLREAAAHARDGELSQYLAGVPVLMDRYHNAEPATRALIDAAMDARRLGAGPRIPLAWLAEAAPGYLTDAQWDGADDDWLEEALAYVTTPCNGIPGILTPAKTGTQRGQRNHRRTGNGLTDTAWAEQGPLYRLADYLDQYGRRHRAELIPPIDFWTAAAHATPTDLPRLGNAAWGRGLRRDGAQLRKIAATHHDSSAAMALVDCFHTLGLRDSRPSQHAATHMSLADCKAVADLLTSLLEAGQHSEVSVLLAREPAALTHVTDGFAVVDLIDALRRAGAHDQADHLAHRAAVSYPLDEPPFGTYALLDSLIQAGAHEEYLHLAGRLAAHTPLESPSAVGSMLMCLSACGLSDQVSVLLARDPASHVSLNDAGGIENLLDHLRQAQAFDQITRLLARDPASHVPLDNGYGIERLLMALEEIGASDQVATILERASTEPVFLNSPFLARRLLRNPQTGGTSDQTVARAEQLVAQVNLDEPYQVKSLLDSLWTAGAIDQVNALLARIPPSSLYAVTWMLRTVHETWPPARVTSLAEVALTLTSPENPAEVCDALDSLRQAGATNQVNKLLARDPASHIPLNDSRGVSILLDSLRQAKAQAQITKLLARDPASHVPLDYYWTHRLLVSLGEVGAHSQKAALAQRLLALGEPDPFFEIGNHQEHFKFGREPDGSAAAPWSWDDLA